MFDAQAQLEGGHFPEDDPERRHRNGCLISRLIRP